MRNSYPLLREFADRVPTGIAVQDGNYAHVNPKTTKQVTIADLQAFATDYLKVKYVFWCTEEPYYTRDVLPAPFAGAYVALVGVALLSLAVISFIPFPPLPQPTPEKPGRPLREIARQPVFIVAVAACALGYGVMSLLMSATPIAMSQCAHPFKSTALVLEWHVLGMFVPSFFTGTLIRRFGALPVMAVGVLLNLACIAVALSGVDLMSFLLALLALGVGWNFMFIGGTTLFTESYRPEEKTTAQAAMDTVIFTTMTLTSFSSGALVTTQGWTLLNLGSLVPVFVAGAALLWLALQRRGAQNRQRTA